MRINIVGDSVYSLSDAESDFDDAIVLSDSVAQKVAMCYLHPEYTSINIPFLIQTVCTEFGITEKDLSSKTRRREVVMARDVIFYVLYRTVSHMSLSMIGKLFNKDHATVIHGYHQIELILDIKDPLFYKTVLRVLQIFIPEFCI